MNNQDGFCAGSNGGLNSAGVDIQCVGFDIDKDRNCIFVADHVSDGDERERRNNDFVSRANSQCAHAEMQARRPGTHADRISGANVACNGVLEFLKLRSQAQVRSAKDGSNRLDFFLLYIGSREGDFHDALFMLATSAGFIRGPWRLMSRSRVSGTVVSTWTMFSEA